eukprot:TRINITY_DN2156_c0_g1_i1.p1 TRINITY_DN2156_c0_g1~~TRINITY_DN2156_c0_g1_i1.p1  ORF type:complete len:450 (+),score=122.26 TRINITY_DN2156_c0_g1_i1:68-1417(+)
MGRRGGLKLLPRMVRVAVVGCLHGKLDAVYTTVARCEEELRAKGAPNPNIDLVLITGDFQSVRHGDEIDTMSIPQKYRELGDFVKYHKGTLLAPKLTVFIGGNHEASAHLMEYALGGFIAPNIYFLGIAGCIRVHGLRIAGVSGISGTAYFDKPHYEAQPFQPQFVRSSYKYRKIDFDRLLHLNREASTPTVFLSHEWPIAASQNGDVQKLLKNKPFFQKEIAEKRLGDPNLDAVMESLKPDYWFASHLHVKHAAEISHDGNLKTKFLSLDKILPKRSFLQVVDIPIEAGKKNAASANIVHDLEWLAIVRASASDAKLFAKEPSAIAEAINASKDWISSHFNEADLTASQDEWVKRAFDKTRFVPALATVSLLQKLEIRSPWADSPIHFRAVTKVSHNPEEIDLDDPVEDDEKKQPASKNPEEIDLDMDVDYELPVDQEEAEEEAEEEQ